MALIAGREIGDGQQCSLEVKGFARAYTRTFLVETNNLTDGPLEMILAAQEFGIIPLLYSPYVNPNGEFDFGARLVKYSPRRESDNWFFWRITCEYSSQVDEVARTNSPEMARDASGTDNQQFDDPFARPPSIEWDGETFQKILWKSGVAASGNHLTAVNGVNSQNATLFPDGYSPQARDLGMGVMVGQITGNWMGPYIITQVNVGLGSWFVSPGFPADQSTGVWTLGGDPFTNSADSRFDPPPEWETGHSILTITRAEMAPDPTTMNAYRNAVNSDYFWGAAPGQAKLDPIKAKSVFENGLFYYQCTYRIKFSEDGWVQSVLDAGMRNFKAGTWGLAAGDLEDAVDPRTSAPATTPILLDGTGHPLPSRVNGGTPFYRRFSGYQSLPFGALGLPFNLPQH